MKIYIGYDPNGIKRVFGHGNTHTEALKETIEAAIDYITKRPDTGPFGEWDYKEKEQ